MKIPDKPTASFNLAVLPRDFWAETTGFCAAACSATFRRGLRAGAASFCAAVFALGGQAALAAEAEVPLLEGETLEDFFSAAIDYSPRLRGAAENLNMVSARKRAATGTLLPQLSGAVSLTENRRTSTDPTFQFENLQVFDGERSYLRLSQTLFNWQAFSARRQAGLTEDQAEAEYFYELAYLLTDVAERYFNVLQAQDALESIAAELEAVSTQLAQVESMNALQLAQITDLYQAQANLASVEAQQLQLETELAVARESLRAISGLEPGRLHTLREEVEVPAIDGEIDFWVEQALADNQQIRASRFAERVANEQVSERMGAYLPQVSLIALQQKSNVGFDNIPVDQSDITYLGLDVTIPIYSGGSNTARVREARSQHRIAEHDLRRVELEVRELVRSSYLRATAGGTLIDAAESLVESTELSATAMQRGLELGTVTTVDVFIALRDRFRAERDLQRVRYDQIKAMLVLRREAGTLQAEDLLEVGRWLEQP